MREYIAAVEESVRSGTYPAADGDFEGWLKWARQCAERLDPLRRERQAAGNRFPDISL
jgi:hypothetical protein